VRLDDRIADLGRKGILTPAQADAVSAAERGEPFSLYREIHAFYYFGVPLIAAGMGLTLKDRLAQWGPFILLGGLSIGVLACAAYVARRGPDWSRDLVPAPCAAFDYVIFLGCLLLSLDVGYAESHYHWLGGEWRWHLLPLTAVFGAASYRYDNRLALSLALSSLATWLGLELNSFGLVFRDFHRTYALAFGVICATTGVLTRREGIKPHFLDVYLNFAAHFIGAALLSGVIEHRMRSVHFYLMAALCAATAVWALRSRRFLYLAYSVLYGYAAVTAVVVMGGGWNSEGFYLLYFTFSPLALVGLLFWASRAMKEDS